MQAKPNFPEDNLSLDGLEDLLEEAQMASVERTQDFSVEEAAKTLGLSRGAIIRRLEDGLLEGYRIKRPYGTVWRVCDPRLLAQGDDRLAEKKRRIRRFVEQTQRATGDHPLPQVKAPEVLSSSAELDQNEAIEGSLENLPHVEVSDVELEDYALPALDIRHEMELLEMRCKLEMTEFQFQDTLNKLEQAQYKIGYLEASLQSTQEQMRLLTDQHAHQPWWQRWRKWFSTMP